MKHKYKVLFLILIAFCTAKNSYSQEILGAWDMNGLSAYGASPFAATSSSSNMTIGGLTRGAGITTSGTAAGNAWGGTGMDEASFADALSANDIVSFTLEPNAGYVISLTRIAPYNVRRSGNGSTTGQWQYQVGAGSFVNIGSPITWGGTTTAAGNAQEAIDLSEISDLQFLTNGTVITFRIVLWGGSTAMGTWYLNNFQTGEDFLIEGAENYYWNGGNIAANPADGGTGTWTTANTWRTITATGAQANWTANKTAILAGSAGSIDIDANIDATKIIVNTTNYVFFSGATRTITGKVTLTNNVNLNLFNNSSTGNQTLNFVGNILAGSNAGLTIRATATGGSVTRLNLGNGGSNILACFAPITVTGTGFASIANAGTGSSANSIFSGNITGNGSRLHLGASNGFVSTFSGTISNTSGDIRIASAANGGAGVVVISGAGNTWNNTMLNNAASGILRIAGGDNRLPTSTTLTFGETSGNGASTFDLNGLNQTIGALTNGAEAGGTITNSQSATTSILTIGGTTSPAAFSGVIQNGSGSVQLTRTGSGTTELIGQNTYTGLTTVSGGTLRLNRTGGNTIPAGNNVLVSGGVFRISSNQTLNNLTITSGTLEVDAGVVLTINGIFTYTGGTLTITGSIAYGASSTLVYNTGTSLNIGAEWPATNSPFNVTISNIVNLGLTGNRVVAGTLTLTNGLVELGNNNLTVGTISGGSTSSYIVTNGSGALIATVSSSAFKFHVGLGAYNPLTITNNTGTDDEFSVNIMDDVLENGTTGSTVSGPHVGRTWNIGKTIANGGSGVDFIFEWNGGEISGTINSGALYHYTGGVWVKETSGSVSGTATSLTYTGYTGSFSPFAIGDDIIFLPVTLGKFEVTYNLPNAAVFVDWQTLSEVNNHYFEIERSEDLQNWNVIGMVLGKGNSFELNKYSYSDFSIQPGVYYYRLKQVDFDGKEEYSVVRDVFVDNQKDLSKLTVYPNPASLYVRIGIGEKAAVSVSVYTMDGREQFVPVKSNNPYLIELDITNLSAGVYVLKIDVEGRREERLLIVE